ncbi:N-acetyltransferase [Streptomyces avermitilis]|uniref:N-acetyltransferase n=1 Tax=Streptomyces avermitilis TaxID=33903 RepID=UPI003684A3A8
MDLKVASLAERPEMLGPVVEMAHTWPEFLLHDPVGDAHYGRIARELPEFVQFAEDERGEVVAHAYSVPFALAGEDRGELPSRGWDAVLGWAFEDLRRGTPPDTVSAISIVVAPLRPSAKHLEPRTPMEEYAVRLRPDGLPHDPWLRVHVRAGGAVEAVAPSSMTVAASLAEWRAWTGLPFDTEGLVEVPGALVPVHCEPGRGYAVYVEPNVWVRHRL